jgi:signal transduction histidine kinase
MTGRLRGWLLAGTIALVAVTVVSGLSADAPGVAVVIVAAVGALFMVGGLVAWSRRPESHIGRLLVLAGGTWLVSQSLQGIHHALLFTVGAALFPFSLAFLAHVAVIFPKGRAESRWERVLIAAPYVLALGGGFVTDTSECQECPTRLVAVDVSHGGGRALYAALLVGALVVTLAVLALLFTRWWRGSPAARRVLLPVVPGACLFAVVYAAALLSELGLPTGLGERWVLLGLVLLAAAPLAFLAGALRSRLARAGVGELVVELGDSSPPDQLEVSLARALGDPTVEVSYRLPSRDGWIDGSGRPVNLPVDDKDRSVMFIERAGERIGALVYDAALADDPTLVRAVGAAAGMVMENERLHAELLHRLEEVRASRARIVEAADAARRRVERDIHDGAQQRLVSLSLCLGMVRSKLGSDADPRLHELLARASEDAGAALVELRELARGLHPAILSEAGLAGAVDSLAERSPVPVAVSTVVEQRLSRPVEVAAFYVVSECLTNVAKYAQASSATVRIEQTDGHLRVEVADDGVGGAEIRPGSGLEGLADRVAALDGRLEVESPAGGGTRVRAELPCA